MSELKPCPFCGESKLLYSGGCGFRYDDDDNQIRLFRVHCRTCKGRTGLFESLDEAVEAWNRRTNSTTIQPSALGTNLAEVGTDAVSRKAVKELAYSQIRSMYCGVALKEQRETMLRIADNVIGLLAPVASKQPEIVRCKDCKHWIPYDWMFSEVWQSKNMADYPEEDIGCDCSDMAMKAVDFCSRAERREVTT
jgi:Lar family restriction alleviation protein